MSLPFLSSFLVSNFSCLSCLLSHYQFLRIRFCLVFWLHLHSFLDHRPICPLPPPFLLVSYRYLPLALRFTSDLPIPLSSTSIPIFYPLHLSSLTLSTASPSTLFIPFFLLHILRISYLPYVLLRCTDHRTLPSLSPMFTCCLFYASFSSESYVFLFLLFFPTTCTLFCSFTRMLPNSSNYSPHS